MREKLLLFMLGLLVKFPQVICDDELYTLSTIKQCYGKEKPPLEVLDCVQNERNIGSNINRYKHNTSLFNEVSLSQIVNQINNKIRQTRYKIVVITDESNLINHTDNYLLHNINNLTNIELYQTLLYIKSSHSKAYLIYCSLICTSNIFHVLSWFGEDMFSKHYIWITMHSNLLMADLPLPVNLLLIMMKIESQKELGSRNFTRSDTFISSKMQLAVEHKWKDATLSQIEYLNNQINDPAVDLIRVVTIVESPFVFHTTVETDQTETFCSNGKICLKYEQRNGTKIHESVCCFGLLIDLLVMLETDLNFFVSTLYLVEDKYYGAQLNKTWNGMIGDLIYDKADLALGILSVNSERFMSVDFTETFIRDTIGIAVVKQTEPIPFVNVHVFDIFDIVLWLTVVFIASLAVFIIYLTERCSSDLKKYTCAESINYVAGLLFQKDVGGENPRSRSSRIISISIAIATMVFMSSYTALLTANLVETKIHWLVTGVKDNKFTNKDKPFAYGVAKNSSHESFFRDTKLPYLHRLYESGNRYAYKNLNEGLQLLTTGKLQALFADGSTLSYYSCRNGKGTNIQVIKEQIELFGIGLALQKGSILTSKISKCIRIYNEKKIIEDLTAKWLTSGCYDVASTQITNQVDFRSFGGAFMMLFIGVALSIVFLVLECFISMNRAKSLDISTII